MKLRCASQGAASARRSSQVRNEIGEERGLAVRGGVGGRLGERAAKQLGEARPAAAAALEVIEPGGVVLGQVEADLEARVDALIGQQARVARRQRARVVAHVGVAEQHRTVARLARQGGEVAVARIERRAVGHRAMVQRVHAGVQARARRAAGLAWAKWRPNSTPSCASASRCGVRTQGWPSAERQSPRHWSAVISSTFIVGPRPRARICGPCRARETSAAPPASVVSRRGGKPARAVDRGQGAAGRPRRDLGLPPFRGRVNLPAT